MEGGACTLQGHTLTTLPTSLPSLRRQGIDPQRCKNSQFVRFSSLKNLSDSRKFRFLNLTVRASGPIKAIPETEEANQILDSKDKDLVFVAGATGKVGLRTVRELLKLGFRVRAGVRSTQKAESLLQSIKELKLPNVDKGAQAVEKLEIVECDLEKKDSIQPALGNASVVICCIGASEKEVFDVTGPYRIDYKATENLINAAKAANADQFLLVTSLGTNKFGFPAAVLNLFWGVLCWKRKAEEALIASGLPYAIVRPGGMERPTDTYKETHNLTLSKEDTLFGGQVSNLQVAELLACMAKNPKLSYCKIVEAIAETTAPLTTIEELLEKIPPKRSYVAPPTETPPTPSSSTSIGATETGNVDATQVTVAATAAPEISETRVEGEAKQEEEKKTRPLSPYASYDDLKPPTSPTPTASTGKRDDTKAVDIPISVPGSSDAVESTTVANTVSETTPEPQKLRPLSPYAVYEDLKPPTSPSPASSGPKGTVSAENFSELVSGNDVSETATATIVNSQSNSPFIAYEDLKPPTSPSPSSATPSSTSNPPDNNVSKTPVSSGSTAAAQPPMANADQPDQTVSKPRPLSPYTMYEDMKPPTSPVPSRWMKH